MTKSAKQSKGDLAAKALINSTNQRPERLSLRENRDMLYEKFRTNFRLLVASTDLSAVELAKKIGLESGTHVYNLGYGKKNPSMEEMIAIASYYKVSIDDLLHKTATIQFLNAP